MTTLPAPDNLRELVDYLTQGSNEYEIRGGEIAVRCPAHDDSDPSLCLTYNEAGRVLMLDRAGCSNEDVMAAVGLTVKDLDHVRVDDEDRAEFRGLASRTPGKATTVPGGSKEAAGLAGDVRAWNEALLAGETDDAREVRAYLARRWGDSDEFIAAHLLGAARQAGVLRLIVPMRDVLGRVVGWQGRRVDGGQDVRWSMPRNAAAGPGRAWSKTAFFESVSGGGRAEVVLCEGMGDPLTVAGAGFDAIAVRGVNAYDRDQVVEFLEGASAGGEKRPVIVFGDADDAGREWAARAARDLDRAGFRACVGRLPASVGPKGDLTEWAAQAGGRFEEELAEAISSAAPAVGSMAATWTEARDQVGAARELVRAIRASGGDVSVVAGAAYSYDPSRGVWEDDRSKSGWLHAAQLLGDRVKAIADDAAARAAETGNEYDEATAKGWRAFAAKMGSSQFLSGVVQQAAVLPDVRTDPDEWECYPDHLNAPNGWVDLRTGKLEPHTPARRTVKQTRVAYNPDAECPRFLSFLAQVFPGDYASTADYLQMTLGAALTGHQLGRLFWWIGSGRNGKGTTLELVAHILGDYFATPDSSLVEAQRGQSGSPTAVAQTWGARIAQVSEGTAGAHVDEAQLKRLSSHEKITGKRLYQDPFSFTPSATLIMDSNSAPNIRGTENAIWRRVQIVRWPYEVPDSELDLRLQEKLQAEAEGVFAWLVRGAVRWYAEGRPVVRHPLVEEEVRSLRERQDVLFGFLPGILVRDDDATEALTLGEIVDLYREARGGEKGMISPHLLRERLLAAGARMVLVERRGSSIPALTGLRKASADDVRASNEERTDRRASAFRDAASLVAALGGAAAPEPAPASAAPSTALGDDFDL